MTFSSRSKIGAEHTERKYETLNFSTKSIDVSAMRGKIQRCNQMSMSMCTIQYRQKVL